MARLCLPAFQSSASPSTHHLSAAQHPRHHLSLSLHLPSTTPGILSRPSLSSSLPVYIVAASATLPGGGKRKWGRFSCIATPDSGGAEATVTGDTRTRLIAQNIPWACTADDIRRLFDPHGTVVDVELSMYNKTRNRGLAFITMASEEEALSALNNLKSYQLDGRLINVEFARTLKKKVSSLAAEPVMRYVVFVGNLDWRVRSRNLREFFASAYPNLLSAEVIFQSNPRRSAGYGFVSFRSKEEAEAAVSAFSGKTLMGRAIRLVFGKPQSAKSDGDPNKSVELEEKSS